jgi:TetR/AcrR family transcriptional repressor of nem operon
MSGITKRDQIIEAADQLFYQQGFEHTSFAHIAQAVKISRGNFYYHFKTKDDILDAVINLRLANTQTMISLWEVEGETPADRILSFINILIINRAKIKRFGCPVGTLTTELNKLEHPAQDDANKLFTLFRTWLKRQFQQLGSEKDADDLAMHLLARSQGVATLANAFNDENFIKKEVNQLKNWLDQYTIATQTDLKHYLIREED